MKAGLSVDLVDEIHWNDNHRSMIPYHDIEVTRPYVIKCKDKRRSPSACTAITNQPLLLSLVSNSHAKYTDHSRAHKISSSDYLLWFPMIQYKMVPTTARAIRSTTRDGFLAAFTNHMLVGCTTPSHDEHESEDPALAESAVIL